MNNVVRHGPPKAGPHPVTPGQKQKNLEHIKYSRDLLCRKLGVEDDPGRSNHICPFHDDQNPSLSIFRGEKGEWRFKCHGCDCGGTVVDALMAREGIDQAEAIRRLTDGQAEGAEPTKGTAPPPDEESRKQTVVVNTDGPSGRQQPDKRIVAEYSYHDADGNLLYQVVRYEPKNFRQRRADGNGGWIWNLKGTPRVLYRLPELVKADPDDPLFIVEGEKDADNLHAVGVVATTCPQGAGKWSKLSDDTALHGRCIVIVPDSDEAGSKHAEDVAARLHGKAATVSVLDLHAAFAGFDGKDITDLLAPEGPLEGLMPEEIRQRLLEAAEAAPVWAPKANTAPAAIKSLNDFHHTDAGNAEAFAALHGGRVRYDHRRRRWLVFRPGLWWSEDEDGELRRMAKETARKRLDAANQDTDNDRRTAGIRSALASEAKPKLDAMLELAKAEKPVADAGDGWDADPWLLGVANGVVDLRTGALRPGRPEDRITKHTDVVYDPDAKAPRWERFIEEVFQGDADLAGFVQRAAGYSLTGETGEQALFVLHGEGENGKSKFVEALERVLGPHSLTLPTLVLDTSSMYESSNLPFLARLEHVRFAPASEKGRGMKLSAAVIKRLTGEDRICAKALYKDPFDYHPKFKVWLSCNHVPEVDDDSHGFWRRPKMIPFRRKFSGAERDNGLGEKLMAESEGILAWMVKGCLEWQETGLAPPDAVSSATRSWEDEADGLAEFIEDRCVVGAEEKATAAELYAAYGEWADNAKLFGKDRLNSTMFGRRMGKRFEKKKVHHQGGRPNMYIGVGLIGRGGSTASAVSQVSQVKARIRETFP